MTVWRVDVPLREQFVISTGDLSAPGALGRVVVRVTTDEGLTGFGEGVAIPSVMGFTAEGLYAALRSYLIPAVLGCPQDDLIELHSRMSRALFGNAPAKAAIDMAVHDVLGKSTGKTVAELIGGRRRDEVPLTHSVGTAEPDVLAEKVAKVVEAGYSVVKLKLDCSSADPDRVSAAVDAIGGRARLRLDANAGYESSDAAIKAFAQFASADPYLVEQPLGARDLAGMARIRRAIDAQVLADESAEDAVDVALIHEAEAADVVDIKIQAAGGLAPAMAMAQAAEACGMDTLVGSRMETGIGAAAGLHLMAALTNLTHACDLKGPDTYISDLLTSPLVIERGTAHVPVGPGLGIRVDEERLSAYAVLS